MSETRYFINLSNHPSAAWGADQLAAAAQYGTIVDVPFPNIDPTLSTEEVLRLVVYGKARTSDALLERC